MTKWTDWVKLSNSNAPDKIDGTECEQFVWCLRKWDMLRCKNLRSLCSECKWDPPSFDSAYQVKRVVLNQYKITKVTQQWKPVRHSGLWNCSINAFCRDLVNICPWLWWLTNGFEGTLWCLTWICIIIRFKKGGLVTVRWDRYQWVRDVEKHFYMGRREHFSTLYYILKDASGDIFLACKNSSKNDRNIWQ